MPIEKPVRKPRIDLGDITPPAALSSATDPKEYYSVRIPASLMKAIRQAQAREGHNQGYKHFTEIMTEYLRNKHPDLL